MSPRPRLYRARKRRPSVSVRATTYNALQAACRDGETPSQIVERLLVTWLDGEERA